jgi:hypothetical protein
MPKGDNKRCCCYSRRGTWGRLAGLYGAFALHIVCTVMEWSGEMAKRGDAVGCMIRRWLHLLLTHTISTSHVSVTLSALSNIVLFLDM